MQQAVLFQHQATARVINHKPRCAERRKTALKWTQGPPDGAGNLSASCSSGTRYSPDSGSQFRLFGQGKAVRYGRSANSAANSQVGISSTCCGTAAQELPSLRIDGITPDFRTVFRSNADHLDSPPPAVHRARLAYILRDRRRLLGLRYWSRFRIDPPVRDRAPGTRPVIDPDSRVVGGTYLARNAWKRMRAARGEHEHQ
jgi:hypothetical protein